MGVSGIITNDPRLFALVALAERAGGGAEPCGSAPARLVCPAVVGTVAVCSTVAPLRHWKMTSPRRVYAGLPRGLGELEAATRPGARAVPSRP